MTFKLSAITATYNRKDFLPRCIESVAAQSYPHKEHVIVDGGSTDGAVEVLRAYAAKYPHIKWISEKDDGISDAFNKGLEIATGDAVGIIGDDDFYAPGAFDEIASKFESDAEASVITGNCNIVGNDGAIKKVLKAGYTSRKELIQCWRYWGRQVMIPAPSTYIHRRVISAVGGFEVSDRYAMDYRHWLKITHEFPNVTVVDKVLASFRWDEGTVSFSLEEAQWKELIAISRQHWGVKGSFNYCEMALSYALHYLYPSLKHNIREMLSQRPATSWIVNLRKSLRSTCEVGEDTR